MSEPLEIKCLDKDMQKKILDEIKKTIADKKKEGILTEKEVKEIEEMRLQPIPDIQDVQSVFEGLKFSRKKR